MRNIILEVFSVLDIKFLFLRMWLKFILLNATKFPQNSSTAIVFSYIIPFSVHFPQLLKIHVCAEVHSILFPLESSGFLSKTI